MNKTYKKTIDFGKIDYNNTGIKRNAVKLDIALKIEDGKAIFTASGEVWNHINTDIYMGGQCIDTIWDEYAKDIEMPSLYKKIMTLWKKWHLNDTHAECKHQEKKGMTWETDPSAECKKCGWKLGHGWDYRRISKDDLVTILDLFGVDTMEKVRIVRSLDK